MSQLLLLASQGREISSHDLYPELAAAFAAGVLLSAIVHRRPALKRNGWQSLCFGVVCLGLGAAVVAMSRKSGLVLCAATMLGVFSATALLWPDVYGARNAAGHGRDSG